MYLEFILVSFSTDISTQSPNYHIMEHLQEILDSQEPGNQSNEHLQESSNLQHE